MCSPAAEYSSSPMPCRRWNSKFLCPAANSMTAEMVCALCVANCG